MNKQLVTKWITALRSGEYTQTKNYLRDQTGYCCLGVLSEIAHPDGEWVGLKFNYRFVDRLGDYADYYPTELICGMVGFESKTFDFEVPEEFVEKYTSICRTLGLQQGNWISLGYLNDQGIGFSVIADLLEILMEDENDN